MRVFLIIFAVLVIHAQSVYCQGLIAEYFKEFVLAADKDCYINRAQKHIQDEYFMDSQIYASNGDTLFFRKHERLPKVNLHDENLVFVLKVQFINTENLNVDSDLYNYLVIDSTMVFTLVGINRKKNIRFLINTGRRCYNDFRSFRKSSLPTKDLWKEAKNEIKKIKRKQPELILYCSELESFFCNGFMYIKNDEIFIYETRTDRGHELNEYFKYLEKLGRSSWLEYIRNLNRVYVPYIYQKDSSFLKIEQRRSGNVPANENGLCR